MKTFRVTVTGLYFRRFIIKANTIEEAYRIARDSVDQELKRINLIDQSKVHVKVETYHTKYK